MSTYAVSLKDKPGDFDTPSPKVTRLVLIAANSPQDPITEVRPAGNGDDLLKWYQMALQVTHEYEDATGGQMTPNQMVRFFGQSALLTDGKD